MKRISLIGVGIILVTVIGVYTFGHAQDGSREAGLTAQNAQAPAVTIVRTNDGYEPREIAVKRGDTVMWTNESNDHHWPASDIHPTHSIYSEFDPKKPIAPGETWSFTFERVGEWKFHDHLRANLTGTIKVTE